MDNNFRTELVEQPPIEIAEFFVLQQELPKNCESLYDSLSRLLFLQKMAQTAERATTPPPETQIEYTKKARHGHGQDVVNEDNIRQVAGCLPIDPVNKRFLLVSSRKKEGAWVMVSIYIYIYIERVTRYSILTRQRH